VPDQSKRSERVGKAAGRFLQYGTTWTLTTEVEELIPTCEPVCEACGAHNHSEIGRKRGWVVRRCATCGLFFVWPQPKWDELREVYSSKTGYYSTAETNLATAPTSAAVVLDETLRRAGVVEGRLLDVGCSNGQLIYGMRRLGWNAMGLDVNAHVLGIARRNGLGVVFGNLEGVPFRGASFDAINMGDVLEHVRSPRMCLRTANRLLRPGGVVVINTPNAECGFARSTLHLANTLHFPWPQSEAPYHLYEFNRHSLGRLLMEVGFTVEAISCHGRKGFAYTVGASGYFDELKMRLKRKGKYQFDWSLLGTFPALILMVGLLLPFHVYGLVSDWVNGTGCNLTVVARV